MGQSMRLLTGISKDRHGTYYALKKVPARLEYAVAEVEPKQSSLG
jgi:hypothetical protein